MAIENDKRNSIPPSIIHFFECWKKDQISIRAASLTYTSILSIVPATAICVFLFARLAKVSKIPPFLLDFLKENLPERISKWVMQFTNFSSFPALFKKFLIDNLASGTGETVSKYLNNYISNVNFKAIGYFGFISVLITSILLLFSIENSMNAIWRAPRNKTLFRRVFLYLTALIFAPLLLSVSFILSTIVASLFPKFFLPAEIGSIFSTAILVTLGLKFFPNTKIKFKFALAAGGITTIGILLLKYGFAHYTKKSMLYSALYGGLSVLPFFLVWLYLNWVVILSGTLLTYILQNKRYLPKLGDLNQWDPHAIFDKERAILIFQITHLLKQNRHSLDEILNKVDMPEFAISNALEWMREHHWVKTKLFRLKKYYLLTDKAIQLTTEEEWAEIIGIEAESKNIEKILSALKISS